MGGGAVELAPNRNIMQPSLLFPAHTDRLRDAHPCHIHSLNERNHTILPEMARRICECCERRLRA